MSNPIPGDFCRLLRLSEGAKNKEQSAESQRENLFLHHFTLAFH